MGFRLGWFGKWRRSSGRPATAHAGPRFLRHPAVATLQAEDGTTLLRPPLGDGKELNEVAAFIWRVIESPRTKSEIVSAILDRYDATPERVGADFDALVSDLLESGMVLRLDRVAEPPLRLSDETGVQLVGEEVVIPETLRYFVYLHELRSADGPVPCWSYVTRGLWAIGQKELVFTVKREPADREGGYPRDLSGLLSMIHQVALQGRAVDWGAFTSFSPSEAGFIGRRDLKGVLYTPDQKFDGVPVHDPALTCVLLTEEELRVAQSHGRVRVASLFGARYRFFPTAPWLDRHRKDVVTVQGMEKSVLGKMARLPLDGAVVYQSGHAISRESINQTGDLKSEIVSYSEQRFVLELAPPTADILREFFDQAPPDVAPAFLTNFDPFADAYRYWSTARREASSISLPGSRGRRIAGNFIAFVPEQDDDAILVVEDGYAALLTDQSWADVRSALLKREPFVLRTSKGDSLEIAWLASA